MLLNIFHMSEDVSAPSTPPRNDDIADNDQLDADIRATPRSMRNRLSLTAEFERFQAATAITSTEALEDDADYEIDPVKYVDDTVVNMARTTDVHLGQIRDGLVHFIDVQHVKTDRQAAQIATGATHINMLSERVRAAEANADRLSAIVEVQNSKLAGDEH